MVTSESVKSILLQAIERINLANSSNELENLRVEFLGKKGSFTGLLKELSSLSADEKKVLGAEINQGKQRLEDLFAEVKSKIAKAELDAILETESLDVTLPVVAGGLGHIGSLHPVTAVRRELEQIFRGLGFRVVDGPESESDFYNFQALNIPDTHPARDMQDTFFTTDGGVLRTHTSSIQVREIRSLVEAGVKPPYRIVAPGRVFRYERLDATHEHTFYQMEGMLIDKKVDVGNLLYFMKTLLTEVFGEEQKVRLRPGYFPFVEPGFELDIWFKGRWLELLPCGLIHPKVLQHGGIDPNEYQGFAFGLGLSRLVMSRFGIDDIRHMSSGDMRFLRQFS